MGIQFNGALQFPLLSGYLMNPVLGYLLSRTQLTKRQRITIYALGIFGLVLRYVSTAVLSFRAGSVVETFWGYTNFPGVLLSVAVFVFAKQVRWERVFSTQRRTKALSTMASGSYGVYLMHMVFFWYALLITGMNGGFLFWRTVMPLIAYAVCLVITLLLKRIPVVRRILP